ncbi:MAG: UDP-2,4-diacetamido-2,4,6-trideoxy-beta-L-altropyranose hydrolase [Nitrospirae bacterium]|nr:UDP-2,4-diacetamido-2,4,6-trideoxy-beta-L-altropyranose hydrolase [Nitrospirota bacterium]MBF0534868.1 UDP-2,4-diacetamido-2,4,6-trideoxy-beta-L-altropyranose hydrolase [Nitrospirota bacterium]MBF0616783.1 UDP-2,4-diacetamido-2,4,6-trideoxy-beta-L-altropyranose hydrolase [Nitrospirota bacterium]
MITSKTTVFRADSSKETGTGHVMRCLALAEALADKDFDIVFITYCQSDALIERLEGEGFRVYRLKNYYPSTDSIDESIGYLKQFKDCWVVCDGVLFDNKYYEIIKSLGFKLLVTDDMAHEPFYSADIVLNQNLHGLDLKYNCAPGTRLLLGNEFVILRREFLKFIGIKKQFNSGLTRILITLGGMDSNNYTEKILLMIKDMLCANQVKELLELTVVTGGGNKNADRIRAIEMPVQTICLHNVTNMPELMYTHDIAITSGGTTVWELAFMGVPSIVGRTAPIEDYLVNGLRKFGLFADAGWFETLTREDLIEVLLPLIHDKELQEQMSVKAQSLIDGRALNKLVHYLSL